MAGKENYTPSAPPQPSPYSPEAVVDDVTSNEPAPHSLYPPIHFSPPQTHQSPQQMHQPPPQYGQPLPNGVVYAQPPGQFSPVTAPGQFAPPPQYAPPPTAFAPPGANIVYGQPPPQMMPVYGAPQPGMAVYPGVPMVPIVGYDEKHAVRMTNFIFIGTYGKIRALEVVHGGVRTVWTDEMKGVGYHMVHLKLFIARGHLFAATNGHVFCYDAFTGKVLWRTKPDVQHGLFASDLVTLLVTYDGTFVVVASNGALVCINALNGQIVWQKLIDGWTGSYDAYAMLEHKGILYVGNEGFVYAYFMINGQLKWKNGLSGFGFCPISLAAYAFAPPGGIVYDILFVGTYGYVLALDGQNGSTRHHVNLDGTGYKPVALLLDPPTDTLFTSTSGELRAFRAESMKQIWKSSLPGMGYSFGHSLLFLDHHTIAIGMQGKVAALNKSSGKMDWNVSLPGCGYHMTTIGSMTEHNTITCASSGKLYGVSKQGKVLWQDGLPSMGYAALSVSTAVFDTDFNSTTLPQNEEMERRQRRNNSTAGAVGVAISSS